MPSSPRHGPPRLWEFPVSVWRLASVLQICYRGWAEAELVHEGAAWASVGARLSLGKAAARTTSDTGAGSDPQEPGCTRLAERLQEVGGLHSARLLWPGTNRRGPSCYEAPGSYCASMLRLIALQSEACNISATASEKRNIKNLMP